MTARPTTQIWELACIGMIRYILTLAADFFSTVFFVLDVVVSSEVEAAAQIRSGGMVSRPVWQLGYGKLVTSQFGRVSAVAVVSLPTRAKCVDLLLGHALSSA